MNGAPQICTLDRSGPPALHLGHQPGELSYRRQTHKQKKKYVAHTMRIRVGCAPFHCLVQTILFMVPKAASVITRERKYSEIRSIRTNGGLRPACRGDTSGHRDNRARWINCKRIPATTTLQKPIFANENVMFLSSLVFTFKTQSFFWLLCLLAGGPEAVDDCLFVLIGNTREENTSVVAH
jgi:hypothetical protein